MCAVGSPGRVELRWGTYLLKDSFGSWEKDGGSVVDGKMKK